MKISDNYKLQIKDLDFEVIELLDFRDYPILTLEKDKVGSLYLSYLEFIDDDFENRIIVPISNDRLNAIRSGDISIKDAYENAESKFAYYLKISLTTGDIDSAYFFPNSLITEQKLIPENYSIKVNYQSNQLIFEPNELLSIAKAKHKLVLDVYIKSHELINNVKPWAIFRIVKPIVEILKSFIDVDQRSIDKNLAFSHFRQASFGVTIEFNSQFNLFNDSPRIEQIKKLIDLFNCHDKESLSKILATTKNESFIREYSTIIKTLVSHHAEIHSALANPIKDEVIASHIDKEKAKALFKIIDESFPQITDIETIEGIFYEIDINKKEPSFSVYIPREENVIKGRIDASILEKLKNDKINIGKDNYSLTIRTVYTPETTVKKEFIERILIDYSLI